MQLDEDHQGMIKKLIPSYISEAEPKDIGKKK